MPPAPEPSLTLSSLAHCLGPGPTLSLSLTPVFPSRLWFWIRQTDLHFDIVPDPEDPSATVTYVTSKLTIERNKGFSAEQRPNLELDGEVGRMAIIIGLLGGGVWNSTCVRLSL